MQGGWVGGRGGAYQADRGHHRFEREEPEEEEGGVGLIGNEPVLLCCVWGGWVGGWVERGWVGGWVGRTSVS